MSGSEGHRAGICRSGICRIGWQQPDPSLIKMAAEIVINGGVIVFPTRTLYGIGADAFNAAAVSRVFQIKQRSFQKPLSVLVGSIKEVSSLAADIPTAAVNFMEAFWPGRLTIVFLARPEVLPEVTAGTGKIGIRVPDHPVAARLVARMGRPLTGTSANRSGHPGADRIEQLPDDIIDHVDLVVDSGKLKGGTGSTVVDVTTVPPAIIREGEVSREELFHVI